MFGETLLLDRARTDHERRRSLEIINRESQRLSHLVENILRFSNLSDTTQIDRRPQLLAPIVNEVCDMVRASADSLTIAASTDESARASIDADAFRQTLAKKYAPATLNKHVKRTKQIFKVAMRCRVVNENPFSVFQVALFRQYCPMLVEKGFVGLNNI